MAATWMDLMNNPEREQVRRLIRRLKELFRKGGNSALMTQAQRAELLSITEKLGTIYDKYDTRRP